MAKRRGLALYPIRPHLAHGRVVAVLASILGCWEVR